MNPKRRAWRGLILITALCALALVLIWAWPEVQRQQRYLATAGTLLIGTIVTTGWFLLFGPVSLRIRIVAVLAGITLVAIVASSFRITGVTGDLVPIFESKWKRPNSKSDDPIAPATPSVQNPETNILAQTLSKSPTADFPQFYGPGRNAILASPQLDTNWAATPPRLVWKQPVGAAWSGFAIQDNLAVTQEQDGENELVVVRDVLSGRHLWSHAANNRYATTIAGEGPRATPTISSNRVFTFGATGVLNCFDLNTGTLLWTRDAARENEAAIPEWGFSSSPLLVDDKVIVSVGGSNNRSLVAYRATDGQFLWGSGHRGAGYSSPVEVSLLGDRQILYFSTDAILAFDPGGQPLWEHPWQAGQPKVSLPVTIGSNLVFVSSGYGAGCELIEISRSAARFKPSRVWKSLALKSKFAPIFPLGDFIYGLDDGIFTCVDLKTGQRRWKDGRYGHGQGLLIGGIILLTSESGEVILIEPNPEKLTELGRFQVFSDKTWNPPALAGEYLLVRNHKEAACLKLTIQHHVTKM